MLRKITVGQRIKVADYWKVYLSWTVIVAQAVVSIYMENIIAELFLIGVLVIGNAPELRKMGMQLLYVKQMLK